MIYVSLGKNKYPAKFTGKTTDYEWDNRESISMTLEMTHGEAVNTFVNNIKWSVVRQDESYEDENGNIVTPEAVVCDKSDFCVAGSITDHRDGTITVKMGKLTDLEETLALVYGGI